MMERREFLKIAAATPVLPHLNGDAISEIIQAAPAIGTYRMCDTLSIEAYAGGKWNDHALVDARGNAKPHYQVRMRLPDGTMSPVFL